jgi:hypothetical protein
VVELAEATLVALNVPHIVLLVKVLQHAEGQDQFDQPSFREQAFRLGPSLGQVERRL